MAFNILVPKQWEHSPMEFLLRFNASGGDHASRWAQAELDRLRRKLEIATAALRRISSDESLSTDECPDVAEEALRKMQQEGA